MAKRICTCGNPAPCSQCAWRRRPRHPCGICGEPTGWPATDPRGVGATHVRCRPPAPTRHTSLTAWTCQVCGVSCERPPTKGQRPKYCGKACEVTASWQRRRARALAAFIEDVPRFEVFQRDGYRCHLCNRKTNPAKTVPHPRAPTIDHIIPLSKGGKHDRWNCRTACYRCNASKCNRGGGEQFILAI